MILNNCNYTIKHVQYFQMTACNISNLQKKPICKFYSKFREAQDMSRELHLLHLFISCIEKTFDQIEIMNSDLIFDIVLLCLITWSLSFVTVIVHP